MEKTNFRTPTNLKQLRALLEVQRGKCFYCRRWISLTLHHSLDPNTATVDHFFPLVLGGRDTISNVVLACLGCNRRKGENPPALTDILKWNALSKVWPHIQALSLDRHVRERKQCNVCRVFIPMERLLESMRSDAETKVCSKACWTIDKNTRTLRRRQAKMEAASVAAELEPKCCA
jgi:HNH endonuclease